MTTNAGGQAPQQSSTPPTYSTPAGWPAGPAHAPVSPQPPKRSWFARHKILTAILAIVALVVVVNLAGGGSDDPAPAGDVATGQAAATGTAEEPTGPADTAAPPAEQPAAEPPAEAPAAAGIGTAVQDGKFEFVVTGIEAGVAQVGNDVLNEQAQGQFVLVHLTVANIGDASQALFDGNQTLVDTAGREHSANSTAGIYLEGNETFFTEINPGNSVTGTIVFDIPADAVPASVELHDSMFSGGVTVTLG